MRVTRCGLRRISCGQSNKRRRANEVRGERVITKYLNTRKEFDSYNKRGVGNWRHTVTPVGCFGVAVRVDSDGKYWCESVGESSAKYADGERRLWQEKTPIRYLGRMELLGLSLLQNSEASE
jgi:hypothetical protein